MVSATESSCWNDEKFPSTNFCETEKLSLKYLHSFLSRISEREPAQSWGSAVGISNCLRAGLPRDRTSSPISVNHFNFYKLAKLALECTLPLIHWGYFPESKAAGAWSSPFTFQPVRMSTKRESIHSLCQTSSQSQGNNLTKCLSESINSVTAWKTLANCWI